MDSFELKLLVVNIECLQLTVHHLNLGALEIVILSEKDFVLGQRTEFTSVNLCVLELPKR